MRSQAEIIVITLSVTFTVQSGSYGEGRWLACDQCDAEIDLDHGTSFSEVMRQVDAHECEVVGEIK